jgi:hypothetical protein
MSGRGGVVAAVILVLSAIALSGCTPAPSPGDDIAVAIYQSRPDQAERKLEISVTNTSSELMTISRAEFTSTQFVETVAWQKDSTRVLPNVAVDLPVLLSAADCSAKPIVATVTIDYAVGDGALQTVELSPVDKYHRMEQLRVEDCIGESLARHVALKLSTLPRTVTSHGRTVAELDLTVTPTGAEGSATVSAILSTVLFAVTDPTTGETPASVPLEIAVDAASQPFTVTLEIIPSRCDPHAVAEDKRGTVFPFAVSTSDGTSGTAFVAATPEVKAALFDFVGVACGT